VDGIKDGMRPLILFLRIDHVKQDSNLAAHSLDREAIRCIIDQVWIKEIPICIYGIVSGGKLIPE
jgi:hypothetical protein